MYTITGFCVSKNSKGTIGTVVTATTDFPAYRRENALSCEGLDVVSEFIRGDWSDTLEVGGNYNFLYSKGYQDRAVLTDIIPIN